MSRFEAFPSRFSTFERQALLSAALILGSVLGLVVFAYLGFEVLSSARAYVGGEGHWSKAQKEALYHLTRYAAGRNPIEYDAYREQLQVPLGDRVARLELQSARPNWDSVQAGFLRGRNHLDDIPGMSRFFRRFHRVGFVEEAIGYWTTGDSLITRLLELGSRLHREIESPTPNDERIQANLAAIHALSGELTRLEDAFSFAISAGARSATRVFLFLISAIAMLLLLTAGWSLRRAVRRSEAAEASRTATESRLKEMVLHAGFGISRTTLDGRILSANPAMVRILGYRSEAEVCRLDASGDLHLVPGAREEVLERLEREGSVSSEIELRRSDGSGVQVRCHTRLVRDRNGTPMEVEAFCEDLTEQRRVEARLQQAQKLETVGRLTGAIAHEFNNLLTVILSTAELINQDLASGATVGHGDVADLTAAARRGADMVRRLLALSRDRQLQFRPQALGPLVESAAESLRRLLPPEITVRVTVDPGALLVATDPAAIEQILLSLSTNARDAMANGGTIRISVAHAAGGEGGARRRVCLQVSDSGMGMSAETCEHLFEPFFTTKRPGRGSGLGLTMVFALVQQHGGTIEVESTSGQGTDVRIYFPAVEAELPAPTTPPPQRGRGAGTLLLVEDEDTLRRATQRLLEREGYRVIAARNGLEAIRILEDPGAAVDVILSDVIMPEMTGTAMYEELRRRGIQIPVILSSGYTARDSGGLISLPEGVPFIPKPWEIPDLLLQLQRVVEGSGSAPVRPPIET